ncbi:winged helix-turn-helix domain-containing protein [Pedobacter paludis]|uniref:Transcriptional regulator n=1 Tax=Pedobacter paludis TaxID=2203212 RepID=A0A317EV61_9SPHI|nr:winged helix-turn-helix domain-containing protein [Pedobacter paludis]PWS30322.1 transcriptional regulator [Pedobacter paludis]
MHHNGNFLFNKNRYIFGLILLSFISIICVAFSWGDNDNFNISRREILLRKIGHELLLQSGDRTSRVLPVEKIAENEYQIRFERELTFRPDSLVNTIKRSLVGDPLTSDYIVNVLKCGNSNIVYGFVISNDKKDDIVACRGRKQPTACYTIDIKFKSRGINTAKSGYLLGSISFLAFVGIVFFRSVEQRKAFPKSHNIDMFTLGSTLFDSKNRKLTINEYTTDLTGTETRVLRIFALSPNEVIERSRLQKEIWEDEGVIVGRSLDMFISKLRKKLELDPSIKIIVIRGKGYKLEIGA